MHIMPVFKCRNVKDSLAFYTGILDFKVKYPDYLEESLNNGVVDLVNGDADLQLSRFGPTIGPSSANLRLANPEEVDALFAIYLARGLDTSGREDSPVHQAPVDQTWGIREFYVTDPDGNTLCFGAILP